MWLLRVCAVKFAAAYGMHISNHYPGLESTTFNFEDTPGDEVLINVE